MDLERVFIIPLRDLQYIQRPKRAPRSIAFIKKYVARHMKAKEEDIWIDTNINKALWARGIENPPNKIRVKAVKFEDEDLVEVSLPEE
jgi:large subunit ribosomal protein L31e